MRASALRVVSLGTFCLLFLSLSPSVFARATTIAVKSATPSAASQGTSNLNVSISGSGFARGDSAVFYLTGTTNPAGIAVNSTAFSSSTKVTANINIAATATVASFDIVVKNTTGSSGKGTRLFKVTAAVSHSACTVPPANVTGQSNCPSGQTTPGCLDSTFGTQVSGIGLGYVLTDTIPDSGSDSGSGQDIVIQPGTGNIYSVGEYFAGSVTTEQVTLVRYTSAGLLDTTFGCNTLTYANSSCPGVAAGFNSPGIVKVPLAYTQVITVAALQPSPDPVNQPLGFKILAAGYTSVTAGSKDYMLVLRFNSDGSLDDTFGTNGIVQIPANVNGGYAYDMAVQANGDIVLAGNDVVRLLPNGELDPSFGTGGIVWSSLLNNFRAIALQTVEGGTTAEPLILVGGYALYRLTYSGQPDTTFGPSGTGGFTPDLCGGNSLIYGLAFDSSNNIITGGWAEIGRGVTSYFAVSRYSVNGTLDTTFGGFNAGPGTSILSPLGGTTENNPYGLLVQADGSIVLMGEIFGNIVGSVEYGLVRFLDTGLPDDTFGTGGAVVPEIGPSGDGQYGARARLDSNGKIVMAGSVGIPGDLNAVARFLP